MTSKIHLNSNKGVWAELQAKSYFALQKNLLVFSCESGVGCCDIITLDKRNGEVQKWDVKYGGTRWLYNRNNKTGNGGMRLIHRVQSKLQQKLGIKILYVMPDGEVRIPNEKE